MSKAETPINKNSYEHRLAVAEGKWLYRLEHVGRHLPDRYSDLSRRPGMGKEARRVLVEETGDAELKRLADEIQSIIDGEPKS